METNGIRNFPSLVGSGLDRAASALGPVQRFSNRRLPKPPLPGGFFLKKKPPCTPPVTARELENRSEGGKTASRAAGTAIVFMVAEARKRKMCRKSHTPNA
jgi:hypothetical protein